ncbi:MAG: KH domain-containing protein [Nanoarchaeota archaeon]|nr:KH domain-containing protein [Nanoarchaeota archaeon]
MLDEEQVFVSLSRLPVVIGQEGSTRKLIESKFEVSLNIDSKSGEIIINGEDSSKRYVTSLVLQAINYGFSPENALLLEDEFIVLDVIDVKKSVRDSHRLKVVMGRVIGQEGKTRKLIEEITMCKVTIKDNFVAVIGKFENVQLVHEALSMLIKGASHKSFYGYLERNKVSQFEF